MKHLVMATALTLTALTASAGALSGQPLARAMPAIVEDSSSPVILAQALDPNIRIQELEEQIRQLNGRIEEMSFQLLQMQETLRKTQEDNEFRFQDLEKGKKSGALDAAPGSQPVDGALASGETPPEAVDGTGTESADALDQPAATDDVAALDPATGADALGKPAVDLGQIKFDENGNVIGAETGVAIDPANPDQPVEQVIEAPGADVAAIGADGGYQAAYEHMLAGDYAAAEGQFRAYIDANPEGAKVADASFWLGEAQYSQAKYSDAAKTFLAAYKTYGKSEKAPEMLLKLAMSLAALDSRDTACATLREVSKTYPKASRAIVSKVASEQKRLAC